MNPRLDYYSASPKAMKAMIAMEALTSSLSIEQGLLHLIKIRASQLNGCAFCTDMHSVDARRLGESDRRLYSIVVWRDSNFFNPRWPGPRRSPCSPKATCRTMSTSKPGSSSVKAKWST
jgi:AhpD family alkylhydroperoxidase